MLRRKAKRGDSGASALEINTALAKSSPPTNKGPITPGFTSIISDENRGQHRKMASSDVEFVTPNSQYHQYPFSYSPTLSSGHIHKGNLSEKFGLDSANREGPIVAAGGGHWATHDAAFQLAANSVNSYRPLIPPRQNSASANIDMGRRAATSPSSSSSIHSGGQYFYQQDLSPMLSPNEIVQHQQHNTNSSNGSSPALPQIGRSQSTFNFFLSKAKASFTSTGNQNQHSPQDPSMNSSGSLASLNSAGHAPYGDSSAPSSPTAIRKVTPDSGTPRQAISRPSFGDEAAVTSSPTKRSFFGGNRERKVSTHSNSSKGNSGMLGASSDKGSWGPSNSYNKQVPPHSPLTRDHRMNGPGLQYSQFSKSQTDLHHRGASNREFPSPVKGNTALPPLPPSSSKFAYKSRPVDPNMLQSPTSTLGFSRSVDDLSRSSSPDTRGTPAHSPGQEKDVKWGEQALFEPAQRSKLGNGAYRNGEMAANGGHIEHTSHQNLFTSTPAYQANATLRNTAWPQETSIPPPPLAASSKRPATSPRDATFDRVDQASSLTKSAIATKPLPPGVTFEAFLHRNTNISLPLNQLADSRGKEKDIAKGWKPYKVILKEGRLYFYKPSSTYSDQVKALFPTGIVSNNQADPSQYARELGINLDDLKKSKLGTQELLAATSRGSLDQAPTMRPKKQLILSAIVDDDVDEIKTRKWERKGKHRELDLVESESEPLRWQDRIEGGSVEALAHELIYATQSGDTPSQEEAESLIYLILIAMSRSEQVLLQMIEEMTKWTEVVTSLTKEDPLFGGSQERQETYLKGMQMRVSTLLECDVLNMTLNRGPMLVAVEKMISKTWPTDSKQREALLTKVRVPESIVDVSSKWHGKEDDEAECIRLSSSFRPSALLNLDPAEVARQIHIFTSNQFNNLYIPETSLLRLLQSEAFKSLHLFSYDWSRPHFLTKLVLDQILYSNSSLEGGSLHGAKLRASLLRHWIAVASYLIKLDNVGAWLSICLALCSRSISRLATSWKFVASNDRALVGTVWAPVLVQMGWSEMTGLSFTPIQPYLATASSIKSSMNPRHHSRNDSISKMNSSCPFLGNAFICIEKLDLESTQNNSFCISRVKGIATQVLKVTKEWKSRQAQLKSKHNGEENLDLQRALQSLCILNRRSINATSFDPIPLLAQSIQIEPVLLGKVDHSRSANFDKAMSACAQSPLLFPESLATLSILDREDQESIIVAASIAADASSGESRRSPIRITTNPFNQLNQDTITNGTQRWTSKNHAAKLPKDAPFGHIIEWNPQWQKQDEELIRIGTDLILIDMGEQSNTSVPSTPLLAKRFSQEMGTISRPVSQISKRSSLPASNRSSLIDMPVIPLQVLVKSGSLERLVDILVMGLQHISMDASEENIERKRSRLVLDLTAYRKTFLSTYRNFCSSVALFDLLRKRYSAAISAARELSLPLQHRSAFPNWSQIESAASQASNIDWEIVTRIRLGVITFLSSWIESAPQDFAENDQLYKGILVWIEDTSTCIPVEGDVDWQKNVDSLKELQRLVQLAVMTCCIRQGERRSVRKRSSKRTLSSQNDQDEMNNNKMKSEATLDFDEASAVELVEYLESVAKVFFEKIDERDFLMACELFQSRNNDPMAWFIAKNSTSVLASQHRDEIPQVNNMYKLLELIRWPRDGPTLSLRLATSIRDACAAQNLLRGWIAIQIIESNIGLTKREARIEKLLDAVWICRARMLNSRSEEGVIYKLQPGTIFKEPSIASFVECLIVGSLNSSESRLFTRAWQGVALKRKGNCDALYTLVPSGSAIEEYRQAITKTSTPDIGWILKTLAEVSTRFSSEGNVENSMIDYDKYRTMWTVIESSIGFYNGIKNGKVMSATIDSELVELAGNRLSAMQNALRNVTWERRAFQENARMEANKAPLLNGIMPQVMRNGKPLTDLLTFQQDKHRRDKGALKILEYYQQQRRSQEALIAAQTTRSNNASHDGNPVLSSQRVKSAAVAMPTNQQQQSQVSTSSSSEKKTKRMTALFRGAVRPMGGLMGTSSIDKINNGTSDSKVSSQSIADLLSLTSSTKPSLIVNCGSSRVNTWNNSQRSFVFNLSLLEGGHHLLQATNHKEMMECFAALEVASKEYAMPGVISTDHSKVKGAGTGIKKANLPSIPFYGTDVKTLVEVEKRPIPLGLLRMLEEVEARGLREQGIYRISGAKSAIEGLKQAWSKQSAETIDLAQGEYSDIHTIAGAIKQWFRDLPEPVVPYSFYHRLIEAEQVEKEEDRLYTIRDLIWEFPKVHFDLLKRTSQHLALVCEEGKYNLMAPHNIGLVFGTSLLNPPPGPNSVAESFGNIGKAAHIVKIIITMHEWLFEPEAEAEAEIEAEVENEKGAIEEVVGEMERGMNVEDERMEIDANKTIIEEDQQSHMPASSSSQATLMPLSPRENVMNNKGIEGIPTITIEGEGSNHKGEEERENKENKSVTTKGLGSGPGPGSIEMIKGENRDRAIVESIYLDATDAIAVLQDPFLGINVEEEEEEENQVV